MKKWMVLILVLMLSILIAACTNELKVDDTEGTIIADEVTQAQTETQETVNEDGTPVLTVQDYDEVGTCGETMQWGYKKATGELVIIGSGKMDDYTAEKPAYWDELVVRSVKIYGAETIGEYAFCESERLATVEISDTVTSIGASAFEHCSDLHTVIIPEGVTAIGDSAFEHCGNLSDVTLPESMTSIGYYAFYDCDSLSAVTIPAGVTSIVNHCFSYCNGLTAVTIPTETTAIGAAAFEGCTQLTDIYYGGTEEQWWGTEIANHYTVPQTATVHFES